MESTSFPNTRCRKRWLIVVCLCVQFCLTNSSQAAPVLQHSNVAARQSGPTPNSVLRYAFKPLFDLADSPEKSFPRLAGEFEPQKAIVLSVSDLRYQHNGVLTQIVEKTSGRVPLVILYNDSKQLKSSVKLLDGLDCDLTHVSLCELKLDTIWLRDFGPRMVETSRGAMSVDFFYDGQRPLDDKFPLTWGDRTGAETSKVKWTLHGGNLISNGKGLALASSRLFEDNFIAFPKKTPGMDVEFERRKIVVDAFKQDCNINQLLILEPLQPEATKHVDMFVTFLAPDQVLLAQVDPRVDPVNARVLEYNASLLKQVKVDGKPMRVERIMLPPRNGKYWSPYTNIILANDLVLMPVYKSDPPSVIRNAIRVYQKLLPGFQVETVDMTTMQKLEGALHCMSVNVPNFAELPRGMLKFEEAKRKLHANGFVLADKPKSTNILQNRSSNAAKTRVPNRPTREMVEKRPAAKERSNQQPTAQRLSAKQLNAVATYRRTFVNQSQEFSVDAYAVGIQSGQLILVRADSKEELIVEMQYLCNEDKLWLSKNVQKIRDNGTNVREFVVSNDL